MQTKRTRRVSVIKGDGIGPEVIREGLKVLSKASRRMKSRLDFEDYGLRSGSF